MGGNRTNQFIGSLEGARGLAAVAVVIIHSLIQFPVDGNAAVYKETIWTLNGGSPAAMRLLMLVFNGNAGVSLFFVLSGFVLALSTQRDQRAFPTMAGSFVVRRFLRIYPPMAASVLITAGWMWLISLYWAELNVPSAQMIRSNLLLTEFGVNGPTWTLNVELTIVPILLLAAVASRWWGRVGVTVLLLLALVAWARQTSPMFQQATWSALLATYGFAFLVGSLVAELSAAPSRLSPRLAEALALCAVISMLGARFILGFDSRMSVLVEACSSAILVAVLAFGPPTKLRVALNHKTARFLGRISYSVYLLHTAVLLLLIPVFRHLEWNPIASAVMMAICAVALVIPLGWLGYIGLERPALHLARQMAG
jgi:peptidoglycan/LPS O-acetylase OafA/YrhL